MGNYNIPACGFNLSKVAIQRALGGSPPSSCYWRQEVLQLKDVGGISYGCMECYDRFFPAERFMRPICGFSGFYGGRDFIYDFRYDSRTFMVARTMNFCGFCFGPPGEDCNCQRCNQGLFLKRHFNDHAVRFRPVFCKEWRVEMQLPKLWLNFHLVTVGL